MLKNEKKNTDFSSNYKELGQRKVHSNSQLKRNVITWISSRVTMIASNQRWRTTLVLKGSTVSLTPDDDVFKHLALTYATNHPTMHQGIACKPGSPSFPNGTTNGAAWYPLIGGSQDYSYVWAGTMEITVEMSCCKYPPASELINQWKEHRQVRSKFPLQWNPRRFFKIL